MVCNDLEEKSLECHELKITNQKLQEKLQKAEAEVKAAKEEKENMNEKIEFLVTSVKRSTEETLNIERKLMDAKKVIKKNVKEAGLLKEKVENLEHSKKLLIEENDKFQNDMKLSEAQTDLHSVSNKVTMADVSSFSSSESSTFYSEPDINLQGTKSRYLQESSTSYSDSRKPFPHFSETEELLTFKPFPPIENVVPGKLLPPCENVNPQKPFKPSEDGNNNKADDDNNRRNDAHE